MEWILGLATAFWIGILTSISPCPLATNIAAISYISKKVDRRRIVLLTGVLYTLGRMVAYIFVSLIVAQGLLSIPGLSFFLQTKMLIILGPLLIVIGMFLLELISIPLPSLSGGEKLQNYFKHAGLWGAFPLGILFALSFCPVSAALFFGSLVPLSIKFSSPFIFSSMYGIGTGIPVFIFSIFIAIGVKWMSRAFNQVQKIEYWVRMISGGVMLVVGIYLVLQNIFYVI